MAAPRPIVGSSAAPVPTTWTTTLFALPLYLNIPVAIIGLVVAVYLAERFVFGVPYPKTIPLVREKEGTRRFSWRTRLAFYTDCKGLYDDAWEQHLKHGRPVVVPGIGFRKEVILPPTQMRWVLSQPGNRLNVSEAMAEMDQARWCLNHAAPVLDSWQGMLIKVEINRVLEGVCAALDDELVLAFDKHFGTDPAWREIDLRATVSRAIAQANSRFTVGLPLCRDPEYLQTILDVNDLLITTAGINCAMPSLLQPIIGTLLGLPMRFQVNRLKRWLVPLWEDRVRRVRAENQEKQNSGVDSTQSQPLDHVHLMARYAVNQRPEEVDDYELILRRICAANFGALHQTSLQVSNLLLDILASDAKHETITRLRDESTRVLADDRDAVPAPPTPPITPTKREPGEPAPLPTTAGRWTKARVNRMTLADSASRETLRLHSFANRAIMRKVKTDDLSTPDGHLLPRGTIVSFLTWPAQTDEAAYPDPLSYDPFRHAKLRDDATGAERKPVSLVTTSPEYLPFGHGKHACPGRFIVDFELKMIVAHVLRHYDIRFPPDYKDQRPPNVWMTEATFPPPGARICIRRREKVVGES